MQKDIETTKNDRRNQMKTGIISFIYIYIYIHTKVKYLLNTILIQLQIIINRGGAAN